MLRGEASKIAEKRAKKIRKALAVARWQRGSQGIRISDERTCNIENQSKRKVNGDQSTHQKKMKERMILANEEETCNERTNDSSFMPENEENQPPISHRNGVEVTKLKRKRGPTTMAGLKLQPGQTLEVRFNMRGQPYGPNSAIFASFLGVITRQHVPVTLEAWESLGDDLITDLWTLIKTYFVFEDIHKDTIFKRMGSYWRQHKCKITSQIRKANKKPDKGQTLALLKPPNVKSNKVWVSFVKKMLGAEFQEKSEKFRRMRKKQDYSHAMGRKGYARMEYEYKKIHPNPEEVVRSDLWVKAHRKKNGEPVNEVVSHIMDEIKKCNESTENPPSKHSIRDDALARLLGPETRGRVRGLGYGATPSKVDAAVQGSGRVKELEALVKSKEQQIQEQIKVFEAKLDQVIKQQQLQNKNVEDMISSHACTSQSQQGSHASQGQNNNLEDARCQLINWYNFDDMEEIVAEGKIASVDPRAQVHHMPVGRDCWKVWVEEVVDGNVKLYRPTDEARRLGQALGSTVVWPKSSIKLR